MKPFANLLLLLILAASFAYAARSAHAESPTDGHFPADGGVSDLETGNAPSDARSGAVPEEILLPDYSVEEAYEERPSVLLQRLFGAISGTGTETYRLERLELALRYDEVLSKRIQLATQSRELSDLLLYGEDDRFDGKLRREKSVLEKDFPFVRELSGPTMGWGTAWRSLDEDLGRFYDETDVSALAAETEEIGRLLLAGRPEDGAAFVAEFLKWKIFQERLEIGGCSECEWYY